MKHHQGSPSPIHEEVSDKLGQLPAGMPRYTMMSTNSVPFGTSMTPSLQGDIMNSPAYRNLHKMKVPPTSIRPSYISESVYSEAEQSERTMSPQPLNVVKRAASDPTRVNNNGEGSSGGGNQVSSTPSHDNSVGLAATARGNAGNTPAFHNLVQQRFQDPDETDMAKRDAERKKAYDDLQRRTFLQVVDPRVPSSVYSRNVDGTPVPQVPYITDEARDNAWNRVKQNPYTPGGRD